MTLHISAASIHGLVAVCAVAGSAVNYNYSPLRGDSAADSNLEGHSWNPQCAAVILLMLNQAEWTGRRPNNSVLKKKKKRKKNLSGWYLRQVNGLCCSAELAFWSLFGLVLMLNGLVLLKHFCQSAFTDSRFTFTLSLTGGRGHPMRSTCSTRTFNQSHRAVWGLVSCLRMLQYVS